MEDQRQVVLSPEGLQKLQDELDHLKRVKRREVAERLKEARALGDLSENSEYEDARKEQSFVEGRIATLEQSLRLAKVIDGTGAGGVVAFGSRVKLLDLEFEEELEYTLVGSIEADPAKQKISNESPLGRAILGRRAGELVEVQAPVGTVQYRILAIQG